MLQPAGFTLYYIAADNSPREAASPRGKTHGKTMALGKKDAKGIFCLEGDWTNDLRDTSSVENGLRLLRDTERIPYIHRNIATRADFEYYLGKWVNKQYANYPVLYLGFHGVPGGEVIQMPAKKEEVSLDDLAEILGGRCAGRIIYLGSCYALDTHGIRLNKFIARTDALAVCGYTKWVAWTVSTAFEIILFFLMQRRAFNRTGARCIERDILRVSPDLCKRLGFRMKVR